VTVRSEQIDPDIQGRLDRLRTVTDIALAYLDLDELLTEMLDRVLDVLEVDTAAVLLLDESGEELFARAARGIEEEVRQGVRVPIGHGFAGRIAAERRPVVLDKVDSTTVWNPILWQKGIRAMLGVPLVRGDDLIGVLHVGTLGDRVFSDDDAHLLQVVATRIATAVRLRLAEADRVAAEALQRGLLPSAPHRLGHLEFAARYVPTGKGDIGGDWYDVFQLDSGEVWIVTGDVAGHGLRAAIVMGRIRSALRAYALLGGPPDEVLAMTDRKMQHFEIGQMATVAVAVVSPSCDEMVVTLAGHPPPIVAHPGREGRVVETRAGPPLGIGVQTAPPVITVALEPGSVASFYTDGLIERRGEPIDVGLERLRAEVAPGPPAQVCHRIMSALVGNHEPQDDVALLVMRRADDP
jgi:hypothetical protein